MPNLNRVFLMGNLTRDPELRYLPSNMPVINIGIAVNRKWKDQQGEMKEEVTFVDCEGFGRTAEVINQYLRKGKPIFIEGRLKLDQWQDKEGGNRSKLKVVIDRFEFIDSRGGEGGAGGSGGSGGQQDGGEMSEGPPQRSARPGPPPGAPPRSSRPPGAAPGSGGPPPSGDPHQPVGEEDIPF